MDSIKKQLTFFGSALNIRNKRNDIIASNIANAATPNYKARDINFLDEFKKVTNTGEIKTTHSNHIPTKNYNISGKAFYRDPVIASLDGNTVELSVEQMQFAENTMKYQTTLKFLNGKITKMISAIRGE
ncbi:MAG: flagellar basal body rod protein FlgB [Alphaproteobacteria bacterium]|jgi:flagellar basal-body rod protein FlgB|nr:MAG: flagellar basal body rod protein FlgB [Alphaproteobacteria bacterium]|tara:strand:- start:1387 stop:1773 length:387 start_codon:yes stop_codon:yes gene_type:complete